MDLLWNVTSFQSNQRAQEKLNSGLESLIEKKTVKEVIMAAKIKSVLNNFFNHIIEVRQRQVNQLIKDNGWRGYQ